MTKQPVELRPIGRGSFRLSLRIARRDAAQHRGRSALIVALVAIPIVGLSALSTVYASNTPTSQETLRMALGNNQSRLTVISAPDPKLLQNPTDPTIYTNDASHDGYITHPSDPTPTTPVSAYLPAGTRILTLRPLAVTGETASGSGSLPALEGEPWAKSFAGRFIVLSGTTPTSDDQVMVTPAALTRLGAQVGDTLTLTQPRAGIFTIVGTMRDLTQASSYQEMFARPAALDGITPNRDLLGTSFYLPNLSLDWTQVRALNRDGITVMSRQVYENPPRGSLANNSQNVSSAIQSVSLIAPLLAFSLFEVALLAGAAFTVGAQKQQRSLATLASLGGDRKMLARVVSAAGVVLGLAGGIAGTAVGIAGAWGFMRLTADGSISQYPGFHVNPLQTGSIIVFAVIAGWIASLLPARRASRLDVVGALRGSLRPRPPSKKTPVIGAIIGIAGIAATVAGAILLGVLVASGRSDPGLQQVVTALIIIGPILLQIAALIITPLVLRGFSLLLARAGTAARLAARDTARNASRSVPAIGAIMSTIFISSFVITYLAASQAEATADYEYATAAGVVSGGGGFGLDNALTSAQAREVATSMSSILHVTDAQVLYASEMPDPSGTSKATGLYPVAALNPAFRCTQLLVGPGTTRGPISIASATCQGPEYLTFPGDRNHIFVGSTAGIEIAIGEKLSAAARSELADGGVVSFYPEYVRNGAVTLDWVTGKALGTYSNPRAKPVRTTTLPAVEQTPRHAVYIDMVMSPATAKAAGIHYVPAEFVARTESPLSDAQHDSLNSASQAITHAKYPIDFRYESGPPTYAGPFQWGLLALSALITIGSASIAIGLARSEGHRDEAVLGSLGASPRLRRAYAFWGAGLITGVGSIAGVLLGTVPALAVAGSLVQEGGRSAVPFTAPWLQLLVAALGLPLLLSVGGWLTAGRSRVRYLERAPIE